MKTIELNPRAWTVKAGRLPDGRILRRGETVDVDDETYDALAKQKVRTFSKLVRLYVEAGTIDEGRRMTVRLEDLESLTVSELRSLASVRGLSTIGRKMELVERIREDAEDGEVDGDPVDGDDTGPEPETS